LLFFISPAIGLSMIQDNGKKFLSWKNKTFSRFCGNFAVQFIFIIFMSLIIKIYQNPFKFDYFTNAVFLAVVLFCGSKIVSYLTNWSFSFLNLESGDWSSGLLSPKLMQIKNKVTEKATAFKSKIFRR
jgi:hypothetical protein